MRRIIERKVTIVTTTTWTISWEADPLHPSPEVDPVHTAESTMEALPATQITPPTAHQPKESERAEKKQPSHQPRSSNLVKPKPQRK